MVEIFIEYVKRIMNSIHWNDFDRYYFWKNERRKKNEKRMEKQASRIQAYTMVYRISGVEHSENRVHMFDNQNYLDASFSLCVSWPLFMQYKRDQISWHLSKDAKILVHISIYSNVGHFIRLANQADNLCFSHTLTLNISVREIIVVCLCSCISAHLDVLSVVIMVQINEMQSMKINTFAYKSIEKEGKKRAT